MPAPTSRPYSGAKVRGKLSVVAPLALAAIKRIDAIFDIEREISGLSADERLTVRRGQVAPLVSDKRKRLLRHQVGSYLKLCSRLIIRHLSMTFGPSPVEVVGEGFEERLVEDVTRTLGVSATFSFTLHDRTTRATGSTMRESFPARPGITASPFTMSVVRGQAGPSHHSFRFHANREIVACDTS